MNSRYMSGAMPYASATLKKPHTSRGVSGLRDDASGPGSSLVKANVPSHTFSPRVVGSISPRVSRKRKYYRQSLVSLSITSWNSLG